MCLKRCLRVTTHPPFLSPSRAGMTGAQLRLRLHFVTNRTRALKTFIAEVIPKASQCSQAATARSRTWTITSSCWHEKSCNTYAAGSIRPGGRSMPMRSRGNSSLPSAAMIDRMPCGRPNPPRHQAQHAQRQVEVVKDNQHIGRLHLVEPGQPTHPLPGLVHKRLGFSNGYTNSLTRGLDLNSLAQSSAWNTGDNGTLTSKSCRVRPWSCPA